MPHISEYKLDLLLTALTKISKGISPMEAGWKGEVREAQNLARLTIARFNTPQDDDELPKMGD